MREINIKNLNFNYGKNIVFKNLNLIIKEGSFTTILGKNGSGKSTLVKILLGLQKFDGNILIFGTPLNKETIKDIRKQIGVVFENPDEYMFAETVMDELAIPLENMGLPSDEIRKKVLDVASEIGLDKYLEENPITLSWEKRQLIALGSALISEPNILILDSAFEPLDDNLKNKFFQIIKKINKKRKITVINVTNDSEEALLADNIIVIGSGRAILCGTKEEVFKEEKIIEENGLTFPFVVNLSMKLKFYGLVDKIYFNEKKLVDDLWK